MRMPRPLKEFRQEYTRQRKEHPTLPAWAIKQIAKDHLKKR